MAIFRVKARDGSVSVVVRAPCLSCARQVAAERARAGEIRLWRDPALSSVELIRDPERNGYLSHGQRGLIERIEHDAT